MSLPTLIHSELKPLLRLAQESPSGPLLMVEDIHTTLEKAFVASPREVFALSAAIGGPLKLNHATLWGAALSGGAVLAAFLGTYLISGASNLAVFITVITAFIAMMILGISLISDNREQQIAGLSQALFLPQLSSIDSPKLMQMASARGLEWSLALLKQEAERRAEEMRPTLLQLAQEDNGAALGAAI